MASPVTVVKKGQDVHGEETLRMDDMRTALDTLRLVNKHLNAENVDQAKKLQEVEGEVAAYKEQLDNVKRMLAAERSGQPSSAAGASSAPAAGAAGEGLAAWWERLRRDGAGAGWLIEKPEEVELGETLGRGTFGNTYEGVWRGNPVAVKSVRVDGDVSAKEFLCEVEALARVRGPHILPFVAACLQPPGACWLVTERLEGGTLHSWLHGGKGQAKKLRPLSERLDMALGVARGMQQLADASPPLLHRDLKPSNVLLDALGRPRIGDFGLARLQGAGDQGVMTGETGTYLYMAPEVMRHEAYGPPCDVFSFGVVLGEILGQLMHMAIQIRAEEEASEAAGAGGGWSLGGWFVRPSSAAGGGKGLPTSPRPENLS